VRAYHAAPSPASQSHCRPKRALWQPSQRSIRCLLLELPLPTIQEPTLCRLEQYNSGFAKRCDRGCLRTNVAKNCQELRWLVMTMGCSLTALSLHRVPPPARGDATTPTSLAGYAVPVIDDVSAPRFHLWEIRRS
jgi:hypothetical protein